MRVGTHQVARDIQREVTAQLGLTLGFDGTLWLNLGDSYNAYNGNRGASHSLSAPTNGANPVLESGHGLTVKTLANKQLLMMPARVALALQADGWYLRSDIIWHKPNPMPESVTDRPTSSHEHVFLLTKSARYFFDAEAVREPISESTMERWNGDPQRKRPNGAPTYAAIAGEQSCGVNLAGRNIRNVWTIATAPYAEAHFATFPPELAERCIKAGTSERGCCAACGAPWVRTLGEYSRATGRGAGNGFVRPHRLSVGGRGDETAWEPKTRETTGWSPSCGCRVLYNEGAERGEVGTKPCTVLDPFAGAFTAPMVADRLQRHAIGIELSPVYCDMARARIERDAGMFAEIAS